MDRLDDWCQRISEGNIDGALQNEIADEILELLERQRDSLGTRERNLFVQAVTALSTSVNSIHPPNEAGLRRCLLILRELVNLEIETDETFSQRNEAKQVSHEMLVTTVKIIKGEIAKN